MRANGVAVVTPPALQLELTYAVTAWTKAVEDEHRLLSQVLAILFSYRRLPPEVVEGALDGGALLAEAETSVGRPREEKADFWTSVGGQYKASIDFVVHTQIASGAVVRARARRCAPRPCARGSSTAAGADHDRVPPDRRHASATPTGSRWPTRGSRSRPPGCGPRPAATGASASTGSSPARTA